MAILMPGGHGTVCRPDAPHAGMVADAAMPALNLDRLKMRSTQA
ncbi:MAG TPA: hypothetical protein VGE17_01825 [Methylophilus sp.]